MKQPDDQIKRILDLSEQAPEPSSDEADEWPDAQGEMPLSFYIAQKDPLKYEGKDI